MDCFRGDTNSRLFWTRLVSVRQSEINCNTYSVFTHYLWSVHNEIYILNSRYNWPCYIEIRHCYIHTHTQAYIYIYICVCVCIYVCVCVCVWFGFICESENKPFMRFNSHWVLLTKLEIWSYSNYSQLKHRVIYIDFSLGLVSLMLKGEITICSCYSPRHVRKQATISNTLSFHQ